MSRAARLRALPFFAFMLLLMLRGAVPADGSWGIDPRWIYGLTVVIVGGMLFAWRRDYSELLRPHLPDVRQVGLAVAVGLRANWLLSTKGRLAGDCAAKLMVWGWAPFKSPDSRATKLS